MKLFVGIHTPPLLLAAAAAAAAAEALSLYDDVLHKCHAAHAHARDIANPGTRCDSAGTAHPINIPVKPAHKYTSHHPPWNQVAEAAVNTQSGVINVDFGKCSPIGATGAPHEASAGHRAILTIIVRSKGHEAQRP